jgi:hypothetical protein
MLFCQLEKVRSQICLELKIPEASIFVLPVSLLSEDEVSSQIIKEIWVLA